MQQTSSYLFNLEKQILFLFFYYVPCNELNVGKNFKIKRKSLFNFSSYSQPEI
jgi:hypothetical protein